MNEQDWKNVGCFWSGIIDIELSWLWRGRNTDLQWASLWISADQRKVGGMK